MREAGNHRKGAGGHWIGFRSITAAAERPVTFGWHFSWLKARLLRGLGSSAVQRIGGRPSVPSPQNTGTIRSFRRGRSQTGPQAAKGRPTAENRPGALVRQRQARLWNRTNSNFPKTQGPVARREFRHSLRFCAPEMFCPPQGVTPVNGVRGNATMSTKCSSGAVPGGVLVTLPPWEKSLAARRRRNSPAHNKRNPKPAPSSVTALPCHLSLSPLSLRDISP